VYGLQRWECEIFGAISSTNGTSDSNNRGLIENTRPAQGKGPQGAALFGASVGAGFGDEIDAGFTEASGQVSRHDQAKGHDLRCRASAASKYMTHSRRNTDTRKGLSGVRRVGIGKEGEGVPSCGILVSRRASVVTR
jgi:hypothetical protein